MPLESDSYQNPDEDLSISANAPSQSDNSDHSRDSFKPIENPRLESPSSDSSNVQTSDASIYSFGDKNLINQDSNGAPNSVDVTKDRISDLPSSDKVPFTYSDDRSKLAQLDLIIPKENIVGPKVAPQLRPPGILLPPGDTVTDPLDWIHIPKHTITEDEEEDKEPDCTAMTRYNTRRPMCCLKDAPRKAGRSQEMDPLKQARRGLCKLCTYDQRAVPILIHVGTNVIGTEPDFERLDNKDDPDCWSTVNIHCCYCRDQASKRFIPSWTNLHRRVLRLTRELCGEANWI